MAFRVTSSGGGSGASAAFTIFQPDAGTSPTATGPTDTATFTSSDGSITITGTAATDTLDFVISNSAVGLDASFVTLATNANLPNERVLTEGTGINITDGGAGSTVTIAADLGDFTTSDLAEGTNLYFTNERAQDAVGTILIDSATIDFTYDDGANTITAVTIDSAIDHDALLNFVANEHIDHTGVTLTAGAGLSGGGDISASRTFDVDINSEASVTPQLADEILIGDTSDTNAIKKTTFTLLNGILDHDALLNFVSNEHIDHSTVEIATSATSGLDGGGDLTATRNLTVDPSRATSATVASGDLVLIADVDDSNNLKQVTAGSIGALGGGGGGSLDIDEDSSVVVSGADTIDFIEPNATLVTESPAGTGRVDMSKYLLLEGRGGQEVTDPVSITPGSSNNARWSMFMTPGRDNLVPNPSAEVDASLWSGVGTGVVTRSTSDAYSGAATFAVALSANNDGAISDAITVSGSTDYIASIYYRLQAASTHAAGLAQLSTIENDGATTTNTVNGVFPQSGAPSGDVSGANPDSSEWGRAWLRITTQAGTTSLQIRITATASADDFYFDAVMLEPTGSSAVLSPQPYYDGNYGASAAFTGTADLSSSTISNGIHFPTEMDSSTSADFKFNKFGEIESSRLIVKLPYTNAAFDGSGQPIYNAKFQGAKPFLIPTLPNTMLYLKNTEDGNALWVSSDTTTATGMIIEAPYLTTGTGFGIVAPGDKSNFTGEYFSFFDKSNKTDHRFNKWRFMTGSNAENLDKFYWQLGGGTFAKTSSSVTGTSVSKSGTTITGVGTAFTTDFSVGDIIIINSQNLVIKSITSNTVMDAVATGAIASTSTFSKRDEHYSPFCQFMAGPRGNHIKFNGSAPQDCFWFDSGDNLRSRPGLRTAGSATFTTTSGSTTLTRSSTADSMEVGWWIYIEGVQPLQITQISGTTIRTRLAPDATVAGAAFEYHDPDPANADQAARLPTADGDGLVYNQTGDTEPTSAGPSATATETSLYDSVPLVEALRIRQDMGFEVFMAGTYSTASNNDDDIIIRCKARDKGGAYTTFITSHTETVNGTAGGVWNLKLVVQNNAATNSQNVHLHVQFKDDTQDQAVDHIMMTSTASINTEHDFELDITADWSAASTMLKTISYVRYF